MFTLFSKNNKTVYIYVKGIKITRHGFNIELTCQYLFGVLYDLLFDNPRENKKSLLHHIIEKER